MDERSALSPLLERLRAATTIGDLLTIQEEIERLARTDALPPAGGHDLLWQAFKSARELTAGDPAAAEPIILERLLPRCLTAENSVAGALPPTFHYRNLLVGWLDEYAEADRGRLRDLILDRVVAHLDGADAREACWTIAAIGFRRDDAVHGLWNVEAREETEVGDAALQALTRLGIPPEQRDRLLTAVHRRLVVRCTPALIGALRRLADPRSIELVRSRWLDPSDARAWREVGSHALRVLTDVADVAEDAPELQDEIWRHIAEFAEHHSDALAPDVQLGSDVGPHCDSPFVVPSLLRWLAREHGTSEVPEFHRYLLGLRLGDCVRPRQLQGWSGASADDAAGILRDDALRDTRSEDRWATQVMRVKESAWETILRLGYAEALTWFEAAVTDETNPFVRQKITDLLASFRLDPLPPTAVRWVTERHDEPSGGPTGNLAPRTAAIRLARSAASREAFRALLGFGFTYDGKVLQETAAALSEVALALVAGGDESLTDELVEVTDRAAEPRHRQTAAGALHALARANLVPERHGHSILTMGLDEAREPFERSLLVATAALMPTVEIGGKLLDLLAAWAYDDDWLGWRSLEALARRGQLLQRLDQLGSRIGVRWAGDGWAFDPGRSASEWAGFIVGLLYDRDPAAFTPTVASVLEAGDWRSSAQIMDLLDEIHRRPGAPEVPPLIVRALVRRLRERQTALTSEREGFALLARLAPNALAAERWQDAWDGWRAESRAALADALGEAHPATTSTRAEAISLLLSLAGDGNYAVRRSCYRALGQGWPDTLQASCTAWSRSDTVDLRRRAAEAAGWLPPDASADGSRLLRELTTDPEPEVRAAADRAKRARRERVWADAYLTRVREVGGGANLKVLDAWRYGQALVRLGDDACLKTLRSDLENRTLPPHVRHWLRQISKGIGERWRKVTREWPDPWQAWEGRLEEGMGSLTLRDGQTVEVRCWVWSRPARAPMVPGSWGGSLEYQGGGVAVGDAVGLTLQSGRHGQVLFTGIDGALVLFAGQGSFPA